jgi:hypothetical protein
MVAAAYISTGTGDREQPVDGRGATHAARILGRDWPITVTQLRR